MNMRRRSDYRWLGLILGLAGLELLIWLVASQSTPSAANKSAGVTTSLATTVAPITVHSPSGATLTSTPTVAALTSTPSLPEGTDITPELARQGGWRLLSTRRPPILDEQRVAKMVQDSVGQAATGITAIYGLATNKTYSIAPCFGQPDCTPEPSDRFDNRPAWLLDVEGYLSCIGDDPTIDSHSVIVLDAKSLQDIAQTGYDLKLP